MCGDDPHTRVSASVVVQMLERLAAQEVQEKQRVQSNSEPLVHINGYKGGDLLFQLQKLEALVSNVELSQPQHAVINELETLYESLGNADRQLKVLDQFYRLVMDCICAIDVESQQNRILRLSSTRAQGSNIAAAYRRIDAIWAAIGDPHSISEDRKIRREEQQSRQMTAFVSEVSQTLTILEELETEEERNAFVAFLKGEIDCHGSAYSEGQLAVLKKAYTDITARSQSDAVVMAPKWFLPWYELEFDGASYLAKGAFGTVYRAKWLESDVVVKQLKLTKSSDEEEDDSLLLTSTPETDSAIQFRKETRKMFEREVKVWFGLSHPHVVRLFGACHVGNPFFACEYASNGSLDKYLRKNPKGIWQKLHEAALGVQYLHSRSLIHGDLKCNNIVVASDNKAKVTDFGLSSANVVTGAWRWVAPEALKHGASALSLASDIYAFGMCIVEALRIVEIASMKDNQNGGTPLPWGDLDNNVVKHRVTVLKELPRRPEKCTDGQWGLVKRMCAYDRSERIKISTVVDELAALAGVEEPEPESAELSRDQIAGLFEGMKHCCSLKQQETLSTNQVVLRSVYGLLWDRLEDLCVGVQGGSGVFELVGRARVSTQRLEQCPETLTAFTENAMNGYALHRELDKAIDANFGRVSAARGELHDWRSKCYEVLGFQEQTHLPCHLE